MFNLIEVWTIRLHKIHKDVNLLLRDWLVWWNTQKSINHLHFHLIPDCPIWAEWNLYWEEREFFDDEKYIDITKNIKNKFLNQII
jgi:diadenosine tetraphosphate (Ap4A) HIT family hydrolase